MMQDNFLFFFSYYYVVVSSQANATDLNFRNKRTARHLLYCSHDLKQTAEFFHWQKVD